MGGVVIVDLCTLHGGNIAKLEENILVSAIDIHMFQKYNLKNSQSKGGKMLKVSDST